MGRRINKYFSVAYLSMAHGIKNYKQLIGLSFFLITCLLIFAYLWKVTNMRSGATYFDPGHLLWYIAFNEWVLIAIPEIQMDMEEELRQGRLAYLLPRPISYLGSKLAEGIGTLLLNLVFLGVVTFTFTWLWVGHLPFSFSGLCLMLLFGVLAGLTALIFQILIGLSAFWLQEVGPLSWLWEKLLFLFGGLFLPLSVYPMWMQKIAFWTPFPVILGGRSALAIDMPLSEVLWVFSSLIAWILIGLALITVCYRKGLHILNIEGG